ncbi:hypothetical protein [Paenibacillus lacisoli]|nr:hypothetical protein [Paenibacillus sp. JX-17]
MWNGIDRMNSFLEDNYIGLAWPAIGDLEYTAPNDFAQRFMQSYDMGHNEAADIIESLHMFVRIMQDGDFVLIKDDRGVVVGDLGDYYYDDSAGNREDMICHRRGVTWLGRIPLEELNDKVRAFLNQPELLARFDYPFHEAQLDRWFSQASAPEQTTGQSVRVDAATVEEALHVLRQALRSDDPDHRIRAAAAILEYAKD